MKENERYEPELTDWVVNNVRPDMVFVDVGAALGYYTFLAAKLARQVIAFEPDPKLYDRLATMVSRKGLQNVEIAHLALFSRETYGSMEFGPDRFLPGGGVIKAVTLDGFLKGRRVDVVKIDVEGAEVDVLLGAQETLAKWSPTLLMEVHHAIQDFGHTIADFEAILANMGYEGKGLNFNCSLRRIIERMDTEHIWGRHYLAWRA